MRQHERQLRDTNLRNHALGRARSRLGIHLTRRGLEKMITQIRLKEASFLTFQSNAKTGDEKWREIWLVTYEDQKFAAVFDRTAGEIVSFLTPEMLHAVYGNTPDYVNVRKGTNPFVTFSKEERRPVEQKKQQRDEKTKGDTVVDTTWPPRVDKKLN